MGLSRSLYSTTLVGATAGLCSWGLTELITPFLPHRGTAWLIDLISTAILGIVLGALSSGFGDSLSGHPMWSGWVARGAGIGLVSGSVAGVIQIPITDNLAVEAPFLTRVLAWILAGSIIGLGLGLRWVNLNRFRVPYAFLGGLTGGAIGGLLFDRFGSMLPDVVHALGFMLTGAGICFGIALAPILLQSGILEFVSSGDARAQSKLKQSEWELDEDKSYVIGSQSSAPETLAASTESEIFIPDQAIAARHAILYGRQGRFYIARPPETSGQAGLGKYVLRVRGKTVTASQELRDADDLLIGRTALRFVSRPRAGSS
jgi:hypothetical protein